MGGERELMSDDEVDEFARRMSGKDTWCPGCRRKDREIAELKRLAGGMAAAMNSAVLAQAEIVRTHKVRVRGGVGTNIAQENFSRAMSDQHKILRTAIHKAREAGITGT
jgi:hypothetical protein